MTEGGGVNQSQWEEGILLAGLSRNLRVGGDVRN
jgi:hypothetical protein